MTDSIQRSLIFVTGPVMVTASVLLVLATVVLALWAWKRSGWQRSIGWLELLRAVIVGLVALTLNQPEWRELHPPDVVPGLAVLWDDSASMDTEDVPADGTFQSRRASIEPWTEPETWADLEDRYEVVVQPFSSKEDSPDHGTDLHAALTQVREALPHLAAVVLLSDGDWNLGGPPRTAATKLRLRGSPVLAVTAGSEAPLPDVKLTRFDVPTFGVVDKTVRLPFEIESTFPRDQTVQLRLLAEGGEVAVQTLVLPAMGRINQNLVWKPEAIGEFTLSLVIEPVEGEAFPVNNQREARLSIREEELKVLVVESYPRWEYRYLRNALERDPGVEVSCLLYHPDLRTKGEGRGYLNAFPADEDLVQYDVVFLGDVGLEEGQLTENQVNRLVQLVRNHASGLIFLPGFRGRHLTLPGTPLADLYPVVLDETQPRGWGSVVPGRIQLTELGMRSLLTRLEDEDDANAEVWQSLPGFQWYAPVIRAKAGTEILARHATDKTDYGRIPLIVTKTYGAGKILFMGTDGAWRWRKGVEDKYHYRYWGQVARWMAYQRKMAQGQRMRLFYTPDRPRTNDVLTLNANVMSPGGEPLQEATVNVEFLSPSGATDTVRLAPGGEDAWGLFSGRYRPAEAGIYEVRMTCVDHGETLETTIQVDGEQREKVGEPARPEVLGEIAQITRGQVLQPTELREALTALQDLPEPPAREHRFRIWAHWSWVLLLVLLMCGFWIGRKSAGVV